MESFDNQTQDNQSQDNQGNSEPGHDSPTAHQLQVQPVRPSSSSLMYHRRRPTQAPLNLKPRKKANLKLYRAPSLSSESSKSQAVGHLQHAMQQLEQDCFSALPMSCHMGAMPVSCTPQPCPAAYHQPAEGSSAALQQVLQQQAGMPHKSCSSRADSRFASLGSCWQSSQYQCMFPLTARAGQPQMSSSLSSPSQPLNRPPATMSVMASLSNSLLDLAAKQASPAAARRLKEQLLQHVRLAAAAAADAGQPFDVATVIEQLLPDLQEAVLFECREAEQQRKAAAVGTAAARAAAARGTAVAAHEASKLWQHQQTAAAAAAYLSLESPLMAADSRGAPQWSSGATETTTPAATAGNCSIPSRSAAMLASRLAELQQTSAAAVPGLGPAGPEGSTWAAAPLTGTAETGGVHGEALRASQCEWQPEHSEQQQQEHWTEPQCGKADNSGSVTTWDGWGSSPHVLPSNVTPSAAADGTTAAAAAAATGVHHTPDFLKNLQMILNAIELLLQQ